VNKICVNRDVAWLVVILLSAALLRLFMFAEVNNGSITFVGTCGQLLDEVKPLVEAKNPLHFEVFFYPPVAPLIVASTALVTQGFLPRLFDLGLYCLFVNVLFSVATLIVIYLIGREWGSKEGLLAAALYAVTMIAVISSNNVQVYPTFFAMLAVYYFYRSLRRQSAFHLSLIGVFFGLAVASKYFPAMLFLLLFLAHFLVRRDSPREHSERVIRNDWAQTSHSLPSLAWSGMLYGLVLITIGFVYVGMFRRESVLGMFRAIYDAHQHEHPFEYHLPTITRLYYVGVLATVGTGLIAGLGILLPHIAKVTPWEWFYGFCRRNRLWLIPFSSMVVTLTITLGIPAALNLNNYLKYTTWLAKAYASADGGMFPQGNPAPSYLFSFLPENLGLPLFLLGCIGILYLLYRRDQKAIFLMIVALPLYAALELSTVKVNRYALDLMPLFCLFAGILLVRIGEIKPSVVYKAISLATFFIVFFYSAFYSLSWANFERVRRDIPVETAEWVNANVPAGNRIGMKADFWLAGSPTLLPEPAMLRGFHITQYTDYPEYILLPKILYDLIQQYENLSQSGYVYRPEDWSPQLPPSQAEAAVLFDVIHQRQYQLVKEFEKGPSLFSIDFGVHTFGRRTWFLEHAGAYGIQIYKKRALN
jgi:hypothetical protein